MDERKRSFDLYQDKRERITEGFISLSLVELLDTSYRSINYLHRLRNRCVKHIPVGCIDLVPAFWFHMPSRYCMIKDFHSFLD